MTRLTRFGPIAIGWVGLVVVCGVPAAYAIAMAANADTWPVFDARSARLLLNSFAVAGGSALVASAIGAPIGIALGAVRTRGERALACAAAVPFLLPPYVSAMAWIEIFGAHGFAARASGVSLGWLYSPAGAACVLGAGYVTIPAAAMAVAARSGAFAGVGAARHARSAIAVLRRIVLPAARPYLLVAGALVFLLSLSEFAVPSLLQVAVYPVQIHTEFAANYDAGRALALSMPVGFLGLTVLAITTASLTRMPRPLGEVARMETGNDLSRRTKLTSFTLAYTALGLVTAPVVAVLAWRTESVRALYDAWTTAGDEVQASAAISAGAATVVVTLALLTSHAGRTIGRWAAYSIATISFLIPGPAVAVALIAAWNHDGWRAAIYDGPQILVLACASRLVVVAAIVLAATRASHAQEWEDAARVFGVGAWRRYLRIGLPASLPALVAAWGVAFVLSAREADAGVLVAPPGFTTIAVRLLALMHYGPSAAVAGLSLLLVALTILSAGVVAAVAGLTLRWVYGAAQRS